MEKKEILNFCIERKILLDNDLLNIFSEINNLEAIKFVIDNLKGIANTKFITKEIINSNREKLIKLFSNNYFGDENFINELTFKLGLNLEISAKSTRLEKGEKENSASEVKVLSPYSCFGKNFGVKDFVSHFRGRFNDIKNILLENKALENPVSINKLNDAKNNVSIIGMVYDKKLTKNKNIILEAEDLTGKIKLIINFNKKELYEKAENISLDSVLGFKCTGNKEFLFVNDIIFPEANLSLKKKSPYEEYALFIGDLHYGSKNFLKNDFLKFLDYLNDTNDSEVGKIKYLFIVGDLVTGIGNYPDQERDLEINDLEKQYQGLAKILSKIRKDIKIIISPGNHDGVRLMEPQPLLDEKYAWPLYELENVIMVNNPSYLNIGSDLIFPGFDVLVYHGFSFPFYANNISKLIQTRSMNSPEKIMEYLLMNRHLAPTHTSVQYYPCEKDNHVIRKIPDIFVSAHTHKSGINYYNNILLISISTWESMTPYQEKFGNEPDHCKVPMVNLKTRAIKILDFENSGRNNEDRD